MNPLCGEHGAAYTFARQKGATEDAIPILEERALRFAEASSRRCHHDYANYPGAGAAGGLGYALLQYFNSSIRSGAEILLETINFEHIITTLYIDETCPESRCSHLFSCRKNQRQGQTISRRLLSSRMYQSPEHLYRVCPQKGCGIKEHHQNCP